MLQILHKFAHKAMSISRMIHKASVYASLDPMRIARYNVNSFLYRRVFSNLTWKGGNK